jgi:serine/threonine protein phosphatase PrpC
MAIPPPKATCVSCGRHLYPSGYANSPGPCRVMEDAVSMVGDFAGSGSSYFAIFDGHGGSHVSAYAANNIHRLFNKNYASDIYVPEMLQVTIQEVNEYLVTKWPEEGSTSAIVIVIKDFIYTANTGDSRIVLVCPDNAIVQLSEDHQVQTGEIQGVRSLSRSLGDGALQGEHSGEPHMTRVHRKDGMWMIMATAGVWSVMTNEQAVKIAGSKSTAESAAAAIKDAALKKGTADNVSVIVVYLTAK